MSEVKISFIEIELNNLLEFTLFGRNAVDIDNFLYLFIFTGFDIDLYMVLLKFIIYMLQFNLNQKNFICQIKIKCHSSIIKYYGHLTYCNMLIKIPFPYVKNNV